MLPFVGTHPIVQENLCIWKDKGESDELAFDSTATAMYSKIGKNVTMV
jgi:hypothetical protein